MRCVLIEAIARSADLRNVRFLRSPSSMDAKVIGRCALSQSFRKSSEDSFIKEGTNPIPSAKILREPCEKPAKKRANSETLW